MHPGPRSHRGQAAIDYVAVLAAVAALLAVLLVAAPSIGQSIVCGIENVLAKVGIGSGCHPQSQSAINSPCVVSGGDGKVKASLTVFSVKGGGEVRILREKLSDGKTRVTVWSGANVGASFGLGGKVDVDAGNVHTSGGASLKAGVNARGDVGRSWTVDSDHEANELVDIVRNNLRDDAISAGAPLIGGLATHFFGEDRNPPDPDVTYTQGGLGGEFKAEAGDLAAYGEAGAEAQAVIGEKHDRKTGERTVYIQLKGSGAVSAGALLQGIGIQDDFDGLVGITYNADGSRKRLTLIARRGISGALPEGGTARNLSDLVSKLKFVGDQQSGYRLEVQAELDLEHDPLNNAALDAFKSNPVVGAALLAGRFANAGEFNARTYKFDRDKYGGGADVAAGVKFGLEGSYEDVGSEIQGAWKYTPEGGLTKWIECKS